MPPLSGSVPPVGPALAPPYRRIHPPPGQGGLEIMSGRERGWWGRRFALDTPYLATPLGWGEWAPVYGEDALNLPVDVVILVPNPQFAPEGGGGR